MACVQVMPTSHSGLQRPAALPQASLQQLVTLGAQVAVEQLAMGRGSQSDFPV